METSEKYNYFTPLRLFLIYFTDKLFHIFAYSRKNTNIWTICGSVSSCPCQIFKYSFVQILNEYVDYLPHPGNKQTNVSGWWVNFNNLPSYWTLVDVQYCIRWKYVIYFRLTRNEFITCASTWYLETTYLKSTVYGKPSSCVTFYAQL